MNFADRSYLCLPNCSPIWELCVGIETAFWENEPSFVDRE